MKFKTGETYYTRSICDHNCIISATIIRRTAKTIIAQCHGSPYGDEPKRFGVFLYEGVEQFRPWGKYSMCPILGADDTKELRPDWGVSA